jgi:hypothetical protein
MAIDRSMETTYIDQPRSSSAVARRALALNAVVALALGDGRDELVVWLQDELLWQELTPNEVQFITATAPSIEQTIEVSWYAERLVVLLWALRLAEMPEADEQCDTSVFLEKMPPYANVGVAAFVGAANLRPDADLMATADAIYELHWEARDASLNGREASCRTDLGIIQERHHAINWIIGCGGFDWDEVPTDT